MADKAQESLSQLITRILDQLSVSAWLPAAVLVFSLLFLGMLHVEKHVPKAIHQIAKLNAASLALLVAAIVITTMLTQAFEFESIRLLEGYWGTSRAWRWLTERRSRHYGARRQRLVDESEAVSDRAFAQARQTMLKKQIPETWVRIIETDRIGSTDERDRPADDLAKARTVRWEQFAPAHDMRRLEALAEAIKQYPTEDRLMKPTLLGNTLRAYEERIFPAVTGEFEGFVQRVRLPSSVRIQHNQFRSRLDLYCTLVLVFAMLAIAGAVLMFDLGRVAVAISVAASAGLSWVSYRAAVASARGYGVVLVTIARLAPETSDDASNHE